MIRPMASTGSGAQVQTCPSCGQSVETAGLEPFGKVNCPACGHQLRVERVFENYLVVEPLGTGGMGSVYKARDTRLNRTVAVKVLPADVAGVADRRERFEREAQAVAALNHPHICTLHDVGHDSGIDFLVMELIEGESLADRLSKGPLPLEQVFRYGAEIAGRWRRRITQEWSTAI